MADDREIWQKLSRQDAEAFDAFYRQHAPRLQAFLRQIVQSPQIAEDIMQETFTQLWNRPNGFQPERGSLRAYLYGIGKKRAAEWWRQQKPSEEATERAGACRAELQSIVGDAFARLPQEQRTLLWLREVEGHSYAELAQALEVPIGTVRSRLFAAREALRSTWHRGGRDAKGGQHDL